MKKTVLKIPLRVFAIIIFAAAAAITLAACIAPHTRTCYGIVTSYNTIQTFDGNVWEVEHNKPLTSVVSVTFETMATDSDVTDDIITNVR